MTDPYGAILDRLSDRLRNVERLIVNPVASLNLVDNVGATLSSSLVTTYNQDTAPIGLNQSTDVGSEWINSTNGVISWWDGIVWQVGSSAYSSRADTGALGPAAIVRARTFITVTTAAVAPGAPVTPDIWHDTTSSTWKQWQGASWVAITDTNIITSLTSQVTTLSTRINFSSAAPGTHNDSDLWWDTDDWTVKIWNAATSSWFPVYGTGVSTSPAGDGSPPALSPAPTGLAGIEAVYLSWAAVPNADLVSYDVFANTVNVATVDTAHYLGTTNSTVYSVTKKPPVAGGGALGASTLFYYLVARDVDGSAPVSATLSVTSLLVQSADITGGAITTTTIGPGAITTPKIAAGAVTANEIAANTITAAQIAAGTITATQIAANSISTAQLSATAIDGMTITGALFRTAPSGGRIEIENFGGTPIAAHLKFYGDGTEYLPGDITIGGNSGFGLIQIDGYRATSSTGPSALVLNAYLPGSGSSYAADTCDVTLVGDRVYLNGPVHFSDWITSAVTIDDNATVRNNLTVLQDINVTGAIVGNGGAQDLTVTNGTVRIAGGVNISGKLSTAFSSATGVAVVLDTSRIIIGVQAYNSASPTASNTADLYAGAIHSLANGIFMDDLSGGGTTGASIGNAGRIVRTSSSKRYKYDIQPLDIAKAKIVLGLESVTYKRKDEKDAKNQKTYVGFIAEQAHKVGATEWVAYDRRRRPDGFYYGEMTAAHNVLINDLYKQIDELRHELEALR